MKKLIAVLLTLTLVIGMLPLAFAAEATGVYDNAIYEYVFKSQAHYFSNDKDTTDVDGDGNKTENHPWRQLTSGKHTVENTDPEVSDGWGFVNVKTATNFSTNTTNTHWSFVASTATPPAYSPDGKGKGGVDILAFELQIGKPGTFDADISFKTHVSSPNVEIFLVKKPDNAEHLYYSYWTNTATGEADADKAANAINLFLNGLSANARLGTAKNINSVGDHNLGRINIEEAGRYFLILVPNGLPEGWEQTSSRYGYLQLNKFMLTEVVSGKRKELNYNTTFDSFDTSLLPTFSEGELFTDRDGVQYYADKRPTGGDEQIAQKGWNSLPGLRGTTIMNNLSDLATWKNTLYMKADKTVVAAGEEFSALDLTETDPFAIDNAVKPTRIVSWSMTKSNSYMNATFQREYYYNFNANTTRGGAERPFVAIRVNVPYAGEYVLSILGTRKEITGAVPEVYFGKAPADRTTGTGLDALLKTLVKVGFYHNNTGTDDTTKTIMNNEKYETIGAVTALTAGEYLIIFNTNLDVWNQNPVENDSKNQFFYLSGIRLTPITTSADTEAAEALEEKNAIINFTGDSITAPNDTTPPAASDVNALAAYIGGDATNSVLADAVTENTDGTVTLAVPEKDPHGYTFLYWAKGMDNYKGKQIVSSSRSITFKPATEATYYIAVYKADTATLEPTASFYDMNGQLLGTKTGEFNVASLADMPAVAGYGAFTGWLGSDGKTYDKDDTTAITMTDDISFMAQYEGATGIDITVQNENGTALTPIVRSDAGAITTYGDYEIKVMDAEGNVKEVADAAYGDTITVIANVREGGSGYNTFNYWMKNGEVVSFDKSYTFKAFETCTLVPVYRAYEPTLASKFRKIILTKTGDQLMAEFIGFEDAVEKGIMIDNRKIAMTTENTHFTVNMDEGTVAKAYAIDANGTYYSMTK